MNKVLVLGGAGFIGSHLIKELLYSYEDVDIISIGRGRVDIDSGRFNHFSCDINLQNLSAIYLNDCNSTSFDFIFNCTGTGAVATAHQNPLEDFKNTPLCVNEILEFIRTHSLHSILIQISTAAVYGNSDKLPMSINDELSPVSVYGVNNEIAEKIITLYSNVYGVQSSIIRLFSVYGAGLNKQLLWDACNKFKAGNSTFFGSGMEIRDWVHVSDAVKTLINAALYTRSKNMPLTIFNGGSGVARNIKNVIGKLAEAYGYQNEIFFCGEVKQGDPIGLLAEIDTEINSNVSDFDSNIHEYVKWFKALK
jgi:UDP-glucose 4-epimerase